MVRLGAVFVKGLASSTATISVWVRTRTRTGFPAYARRCASSAALMRASDLGLRNTTLPLAM